MIGFLAPPVLRGRPLVPSAVLVPLVPLVSVEASGREDTTVEVSIV